MGYKVLMLDTTASAQGASVRNFGFVTVTGRPGESAYGDKVSCYLEKCLKW